MTTKEKELRAQFHWEFLRDLQEPGSMSLSLMRTGLELEHMKHEQQVQMLAPEVGELAVSGSTSVA